MAFKFLLLIRRTILVICYKCLSKKGSLFGLPVNLHRHASHSHRSESHFHSNENRSHGNESHSHSNENHSHSNESHLQ